MILKCLNDEDVTIRHRALDLVRRPAPRPFRSQAPEMKVADELTTQ